MGRANEIGQRVLLLVGATCRMHKVKYEPEFGVRLEPQKIRSIYYSNPSNILILPSNVVITKADKFVVGRW